MREGDVPDAAHVVFVAAGDDPVAIRCPAHAGHLFDVLFDFVNELESVLRCCVLDLVRHLRGQDLVVHFEDGPNQDLSLLADCGDLVALVVELAEPDLLLVAAQSCHARRGNQRGRASVVLQKGEPCLINIVVLALRDLPLDGLLKKFLKSIRQQHRVFRQVYVQLLQ